MILSVPINWYDAPTADDLDAAYRYLTLLLTEDAANRAVAKLKAARVVTRRANDVLRAVGRPALPTSDPGVACVIKKARLGMAQAPVLVATFDGGADIADGYHRVSAVWRNDPFDTVQCAIGHCPGVSL